MAARACCIEWILEHDEIVGFDPALTRERGDHLHFVARDGAVHERRLKLPPLTELKPIAVAQRLLASHCERVGVFESERAEHSDAMMSAEFVCQLRKQYFPLRATRTPENVRP